MFLRGPSLAHCNDGSENCRLGLENQGMVIRWRRKRPVKNLPQVAEVKTPSDDG
jgi:hypothetical protein